MRAARELGFTLLTQTVSFFASLAEPGVEGAEAARGVCVSLAEFPFQHFPFKSRGADWKLYTTIPQYFKVLKG